MGNGATTTGAVMTVSVTLVSLTTSIVPVAIASAVVVSTTTQGSMLITKKSKLEPPEPLDSKPNLIGRDDIPGISYEEKKNV